MEKQRGQPEVRAILRNGILSVAPGQVNNRFAFKAVQELKLRLGHTSTARSGELRRTKHDVHPFDAQTFPRGDASYTLRA